MSDSHSSRLGHILLCSWLWLGQQLDPASKASVSGTFSLLPGIGCPQRVPPHSTPPSAAQPRQRGRWRRRFPAPAGPEEQPRYPPGRGSSRERGGRVLGVARATAGDTNCRGQRERAGGAGACAPRREPRPRAAALQAPATANPALRPRKRPADQIRPHGPATAGGFTTGRRLL